MATLGGASPFPVEQEVPGHVRLIELRVSTANPKPLAAQVGSFTIQADGSLSFTAGVSVPSLVTQPSSQSGECGGSMVFSVGATGDGPLSYQWYFGSMSIAGATDNTLLLGGLSFANAGGYSVVVGNAGGSVTSSVVTLTVVEPAAVALSIMRAGTNVLISWLQTCRNFTLEETVNLPHPPGTWSPVSGPPMAVGGRWQLEIPATRSNVFYRLSPP